MSVLITHPTTFRALSMEVHADRLTANLTITVAPGPITLHATGDGADLVRAEVDRGTVRLTGGPRTTGRGGVTITTSGTQYNRVVYGDAVFNAGTSTAFIGANVTAGSVYVNGERISPDLLGQTDPPQVTVTVPEGTPVTLTSVHGDTEIGDTRGNLAVIQSGHGRVTAGQVAGLGARITGSGDVQVHAVAGAVTAQVTGSGSVRVAAGYAPRARLTVTGSGDITFGGTADTAELAVTGSGDVYLAHALTPPTRQRTGTGDIRVGRIGGVRQ